MMAINQAIATSVDSPSFHPKIPRTADETGLNLLLIEDLILKALLSQGFLSGKEIAATLCLGFTVIEPILADLKNRLLIGHRSNSGLGDFIYMLSDQGRERAQNAYAHNTYVGTAPVSFRDYLHAMALQSIRTEKPDEKTLKNAFTDLLVDPSLFDILGPAIHAGRGLFLYGEPGNGKTSIAERVTRSFHQGIYIPKMLLIDGQWIKLYDPQCHQLYESSASPEEAPLIPSFDTRWVRIERPVVVVGGELTLDSLELKYNELTRISEAPLQMKANGGVFLIDDFGRQRVHHVDLLNRWIVPLEKRIDFLTLPNGNKIEIPFDQLIIFSTNLDPKDLVDDAFLRRIPYKVHVANPTEDEFRNLFRFMAPKYNIDYDDHMVSYLVARYYQNKRPYRCCQARDLLEQVVHACAYRGIPPVLTEELIDLACRNYFAAMSL